MVDKVDYLTSDEEENKAISPISPNVDENGHIKDKGLISRFKGKYPILKPSNIDYMDVSAQQIISVSASLIPFLEHDDANRALMGSNMQRQAVPLLFP